jgi:flotillin
VTTPAPQASNDRVALDRTLIDQLPQIVREAAAGLAGANVNVLSGADGLSEIAAGLVGQGLTILDSIKKNLAAGPEATAAAAAARLPQGTQQDGQPRG